MTFSLKKKLLLSLNRPIRPQDVFATSLYTGNGGTQTITNGLDLAGKGGLVWSKNRVTASDPQNRHRLYDSVRGINRPLSCDNTNAEQGLNVFSSWNADGFTLGGGNPSASNVSGEAYASWSFRRAKKFFDVVTYTGNGQSGRQIPHGLGDVPGMIVVKARSAASNWTVRHRSATGNLYLDLTKAQEASFNHITAMDAGTFTVSSADNVNTNGVQYVAYLFAHNPDLIQCGSIPVNSGGSFGFNWPWEIQFALLKGTSTDNWYIFDAKRGSSRLLSPNTANAEVGPFTPGSQMSSRYSGLTATQFNGSEHNPNDQIPFLIIRAPT